MAVRTNRAAPQAQPTESVCIQIKRSTRITIPLDKTWMAVRYVYSPTSAEVAGLQTRGTTVAKNLSETTIGATFTPQTMVPVGQKEDSQSPAKHMALSHNNTSGHGSQDQSNTI